MALETERKRGEAGPHRTAQSPGTTKSAMRMSSNNAKQALWKPFFDNNSIPGGCPLKTSNRDKTSDAKVRLELTHDTTKRGKTYFLKKRKRKNKTIRNLRMWPNGSRKQSAWGKHHAKTSGSYYTRSARTAKMKRKYCDYHREKKKMLSWKTSTTEVGASA